MKVICMIPARLDSSRFHRKIMAKLGDFTMLGQVIESAKKISLFDEIYVAACSKEVVDEANKHGIQAFLTEPDLPNGTMRIISAIQDNDIKGDIFVNLQADEPFVNEEVIKVLLNTKGESDIWTLKTKIGLKKAKEPSNVKVVTDRLGKALYFSRSIIPFPRNETENFYKHVGLYAFSEEAIKKIQNLNATPLEQAECLEQLRWIENGMSIRVSEVTTNLIGIDTKEDLKIAQRAIVNKDLC
ncbi:MAG: 3-deoxy-manno-octulosonate cytidylyltransferase [Chlamydiia bacterium]|nr:3-deoxy-manno-octulosonate cytidylyltransferase [Chlamydiia bacterium]